MTTTEQLGGAERPALVLAKPHPAPRSLAHVYGARDLEQPKESGHREPQRTYRERARAAGNRTRVGTWPAVRRCRARRSWGGVGCGPDHQSGARRAGRSVVHRRLRAAVAAAAGRHGVRRRPAAHRGHDGRALVRQWAGRARRRRSDDGVGAADRWQRASGHARAGVRRLTRPASAHVGPDHQRTGHDLGDQASVHRCVEPRSPRSAAVDSCRSAVGSAAAAVLHHRGRRRQWHSGAGVLDRRRLVRLRSQPETARLRDHRRHRPRHVGGTDVVGGHQQPAQRAAPGRRPDRFVSPDRRPDRRALRRLVLRHRPARYARSADRRTDVAERRTRATDVGPQWHVCGRTGMRAVDADRPGWAGRAGGHHTPATR